ncbi:MAG TPA: hypothetical protein PK147_00415 [Saprospiraceae bacterium]|nr:hypothetical protein [Saprospiraceae bacterium]MCB9329298.1 sulfotransferase family protein [Lewinellaceae bacterium]HPK09860.1 hypothetical protein [Saprospiraceae bacterium]HPQ20277.1 hypothetical protein [Saprospiraceae bacterium]
MIVNMVSGPRNISTAMMYSFGQRDRCIPIDEPFYGYYLSTSGVTHPSSSHIVSSMPLRTELIIQNIKGLDSEDSLVFVKNMGHHLRNMDWEFMMPFTNFFLIREPKKVIHSFAKVIPNPSIDDIGIKDQYLLFEYFKSQHIKPIIIDSDTILNNPNQALQTLCHNLGIEYEKSMMSWEQGPKPYDGIWAPYWYQNVWSSTGFQSSIDNDNISLPVSLQPLYEEAQSYYNELSKNLILK